VHLQRGVPEKHNTDTFQIGVAGSSSQKNYVFDTNLGANNPRIGVDPSTSQLNYNKDAVSVGNATNSLKSIVANIGNGATNPKLTWNSTANEWQFTNDGINFDSIGSGTGSGGSGINLLKNPGFENGITQGWSNTGGTFAAVTSGSNLLVGKGSATFTASATGQSFQSDLFTIPNGLKSQACVASMLYLGGSSNLTLRVLDNSSNILASQILSAATLPRTVALPFQCPSTGSAQLQVRSTGSSALIATDQMFLGQNTIFSLSQATWVGSANSGTASFADPNHTGGGFFPFISPGAPTYTTAGRLLAPPITTQFGFTADLSAGEYTFTFTGSINTAANCLLSWIDAASNPVGDSGLLGVNGATAMALPNFVTHVTITTPGTKTYYFGVNQASENCVLNGTPTAVNVYRFPSQSEQAVKAETINWIVDANQTAPSSVVAGPTGGIFLAAFATGVAMDTSPNSLPTMQLCSDGSSSSTTCPAAFGGLSVRFDVPAAGIVKVCADYPLVAYDNAFLSTRISQYSLDGSSRLQAGNGSNYAGQTTTGNSPATSQHSCEFFKINAAGPALFVLEGSTAGTPSYNLSLAKLHWLASPVTQNVPAPILVGSVMSPSTGVMNMVSANIDSTATILSQYGNWLTSVGHPSAGKFDLVITAGVFNSGTPPHCTMVPVDNGAALVAAHVSSVVTSTGFSYTISNAGGGVDTPSFVMCFGPQ
jgi:hypothetical protein